ncbi:head maturation protease, ClpP-related [Paracoccus aerius]|uniref:ATP-dependent Clp protease proteolytic subunit n=1 Tax=Paracoccus aerius TaxID=1915382 RepID=A0ABS1SDN2_9RHOB|nr:head maturation protease, ClpP-related [Paracoccus aerius]MBL3675611.1 Clp protease ClpP [Paracoccus aerius]GHG35550.1 hypothetical protein GCM10017322_37990 [Paracoccus aerius]
MACTLDGQRLLLTGYVGAPSIYDEDGTPWMEGFTYEQVVARLREAGDDTDLTVYINSGGGFADEGASIRSALSERAGKTDVVITGIAASAASLIAMAGETVSMALGSTMMIHDPATITIGNAADHETATRALHSLGDSCAAVYAKKSGKTVQECRDIMRREEWFNPETAVAAGFANEILDERAVMAAAFPYEAYAHAPSELVEMAKEKGWRARASLVAAVGATPTAALPAATNRQPTEVSMTDKTQAGQTPAEPVNVAQMQADAVRADRERRAAIMALDEAKGRETLAEHLYASTEMTVDAVKAVLAAAPAPQAEAPEAANLATAGLGGQPEKKTQMRVDIVATARQRAGMKGA